MTLSLLKLSSSLQAAKRGRWVGKLFPTEEEAKEAMQSIGKSIAKGIVMGREVALFSWLERWHQMVWADVCVSQSTWLVVVLLGMKYTCN